ncbi:acidic leucine-rich nuclear phosphoprotein 32 family member A [Tanacetum coccineum]
MLGREYLEGVMAVFLRATTTTGGSSNHQRQQQPPAAAATTGGNLAVNRSQPKSTAVNLSQPQSTKVNSGQLQHSYMRRKHSQEGVDLPSIVALRGKPKDCIIVQSCKESDPKRDKGGKEPLIKKSKNYGREFGRERAATERHNQRTVKSRQDLETLIVRKELKSPDNRGKRIFPRGLSQGSSNVTLSVELTNFEHTDLSINSESTEVDASPVNDDNANANEGNAEDDDVAHVLDDDDGLWRAYFPDSPVGMPVAIIQASLNSLMGKLVQVFPLACEWEEIQRRIKRIFSLLLSYFDLASWYNNQDKVVMGNNVYTVGDRVKLGLQLKLRILWRKNKQRIKADHFTRYGSAEEARNHLPPKKVWGDRTEDEWNNLVDWWSHLDRVARSLQNAANRAKNTILTHQGKKSFAQGRNEYKVQKGHYEDLIETWRKTHSRLETGVFKKKKNRKMIRNWIWKSIQDRLEPASSRARQIKISWMKVVDVKSEELGSDIEAKKIPSGELLRKQTTEAASKLGLFGALKLTRLTKIVDGCMEPSIDELARDKAGEDNDVEEDEQQTCGDEQQSGGDYSEDEEGDNEEVQDESEESD